MLEAAPAATVLVAASGEIRLLNHQAEHLFSYGQDELVGQTVELLLPERLREVHTEHRRRYAAHLKLRPMGVGLELSARRKDGNEIPVEVSLSELELDGEPVVIASIRDCTERRQKEAALRAQAAELRSQAELLEVVHDAVIVREPTTSSVAFWNRAAERLYGWTRAEARGRVTHTLLQTEFPTSLALVDAALTRDGVWEGELRHVTKNGRRLVVASWQALQRDERGQPTAVLEINRDITAQRRAEHGLVTSEQRFRILSELTSAFAYAARILPDGSRAPEWITEAVTTVTGYSPAEISEGRTILSLVHPDDQARAADLNARVLAGTPATEELRLVTKDGQTRWVRLYNQPEVDPPTGRVVRIYGAVQDITAVRELEQQKDALLSVVSHDLRNPLSAIKTCLELALDREPPNAPPLFHQLLVTAAGATERLERISNDLLDLARLQLGCSLPLQRRPVDLVAVVRHLIVDQQQLTDRHSIRVESTVPTLFGNWDGPRLQRVIENLLNNAVKYSPAGGEVVVDVCCQQEQRTTWAVLSVRDEGLGIPAGELPHLFTRFFRASNVAGEMAGLGVGLAGAKQVIEQHGGTISVASEEGVGSTFTIRLPC
ncbi:MAG: PAS domain S-box protein [Chloroflexi bacterium]|nr:PAS domain S-box protein [Chloroflexota bacterium]